MHRPVCHQSIRGTSISMAGNIVAASRKKCDPEDRMDLRRPLGARGAGTLLSVCPRCFRRHQRNEGRRESSARLAMRRSLNVNGSGRRCERAVSRNGGGSLVPSVPVFRRSAAPRLSVIPEKQPLQQTTARQARMACGRSRIFQFHCGS
jgi:hypothetical protein